MRPFLKTVVAIVGLSIPLTVHALETLPLKAPAPADNPTTAAKVELGKKLYFDARLSANNTVSCNSCHNVQANGDDGSAVSTGIHGQKGGRSSPTVWNSAFLSAQFWDGRAATLEEQAKGPLTNPIEMGMKDHDAVIAKVKAIPGYVKEFEKVFGKKNPVTIDHLAKAIAAFERTLITPDSPVDRYIKGDKKALTEQQVRGMQLVQSVGCVACHMGPNYAGPAGLPLGTGFYQKFPMFPDASLEKKYGFTKDLGRYGVTQKDSDKNFWRVPTWRNVARTAPYFHNGAVKTLDEAVRVMAKTQLNRTLKDDEVRDIVAFLEGLNGTYPKILAPELPGLTTAAIK
ncbi:MAG: cytochrome-c peroxidase [Oligoflexia bacterium]|jgi:cytochrome c peroxidase